MPVPELHAGSILISQQLYKARIIISPVLRGVERRFQELKLFPGVTRLLSKSEAWLCGGRREGTQIRSFSKKCWKTYFPSLNILFRLFTFFLRVHARRRHFDVSHVGSGIGRGRVCLLDGVLMETQRLLTSNTNGLGPLESARQPLPLGFCSRPLSLATGLVRPGQNKQRLSGENCLFTPPPPREGGVEAITHNNSDMDVKTLTTQPGRFPKLSG